MATVVKEMSNNEILQYLKRRAQIIKDISTPEGLLKHKNELTYDNDGNGEIRKIRRLIIEKLKNENKTYTLDELLKMKTDAKVKKYNTYLSYTYIFANQESKKFLEILGKNIIKDMNLEDYKVGVVHPFDGKRQDGEERAWLAIVPKNKNFKDAWQFFLQIESNIIECGWCSGKNICNEYETNLEEVQTYEEIIKVLASLKDEIIERNMNLDVKDLDINEQFKKLYWWQIIALSMYFEDKDAKYSENELNEHKIIKYAKELKKPNSTTFSNEMRNHSNFDSKDRRKGEYFIFYKEDYNRYSLNDEGKKYIQNNLKKFFELCKEIKGKNKMDKPKLNQILYGPPGTGKTYNTIVEAIKILDKNLFAEYDSITNLEDKNKKYEELEKKFNKFKEDGQIEFVTFHQSYSYEEFVEGIKPEIDWNEDKEKAEVESKKEDNNYDDKNKTKEIRYIGKRGVFREICKRAEEPIMVDIKQFNTCYDKFITEFKDNKATIKKDEKNIAITINSANNLYVYSGDDTEKDPAGSIKPLHIITQKTDKQRTPYLKAITKHLVENYGLEIKENKNNNNYVLIIDEINRGNISKIFGELITLIEEDKRGKLKVRLPYSQDEFTVPENLYIIGTMNTSDRSIASVDIALRRRFTFKEMMPEIKLIPNKEIYGLNLRDIFKTLNNRISVLLDRDHQVGHSYFMNIENETDFERVWFDCITPLLNEYFYGDWEKLRALLGDASDQKKSFIKKINDVTFANNYTCDDDDKYDFSSEDDLKEGFGEALENAFSKKKDDNKSKDAGQEE